MITVCNGATLAGRDSKRAGLINYNWLERRRNGNRRHNILALGWGGNFYLDCDYSKLFLYMVTGPGAYNRRNLPLPDVFRLSAGFQTGFIACPKPDISFSFERDSLKRLGKKA